MVSKATTEAVAGSAASVLAMLATFPLKVSWQRARTRRRTLKEPLVCNVSYLQLQKGQPVITLCACCRIWYAVQQ